MGSGLAFAGLEFRQAIRSTAVQLFEVSEILLHRLVLAKTRYESLYSAFVLVDLLLQLVDGLTSADHLSFCFSNRGARTGGALCSDLLLEIVKPRSRRLY